MFCCLLSAVVCKVDPCADIKQLFDNISDLHSNNFQHEQNSLAAATVTFTLCVTESYILNWSFYYLKVNLYWDWEGSVSFRLWNRETDEVRNSIFYWFGKLTSLQIGLRINSRLLGPYFPWCETVNTPTLNMISFYFRNLKSSESESFSLRINVLQNEIKTKAGKKIWEGRDGIFSKLKFGKVFQVLTGYVRREHVMTGVVLRYWSVSCCTLQNLNPWNLS